MKEVKHVLCALIAWWKPGQSLRILEVKKYVKKYVTRNITMCKLQVILRKAQGFIIIFAQIRKNLFKC